MPPRESRLLVSEFTLIRLDDGPTDWTGFRQGVRVDGVAVKKRGPSLQELLQDPRLTWQQRWERVRDLCAAHNLGALARTVNLPTFALNVLRASAQARFRFSARRPETIEGVSVHVLEDHGGLP